MFYDFISQYSKMLTNLSVILSKAESHAEQKKFDIANLLSARLAPDQFPFVWQVQATCDMAVAFASKLSGKEAPKQENKETTIADLRGRIQKTVAFLNTVKPEDFKDCENRKILNPRREGKFLPGNEFAMQQAIPNFYFHMTTLYSILRNNGVDIGKKDYLGDLNYRPL